MNPGVEEQVIYRIANAPLRAYPFPHLYIDSIFPPEDHARLRRNWPNASQLVTLESTGRVPKGTYPERFIMPLRSKEVNALPEERREFWSGFADWMLASNRFLFTLIDKFEPYVRSRFGSELEHVGFSHEVLVVRDHSNYNLGPHTDSPRHVLSLLFYCPDDDAHRHLGTSIYTPVDPAFRCEGGPHYPFDRFHKVATMEYRPNSLFAFFKTDNSFHGVEPVKDAEVLRDLILYDIQVEAAAEATEAREPAAVEARNEGSEGGLGLRMLKNILRGSR